MENHFLLPQSKLDDLTAEINLLKQLLLEIKAAPRQLTDWVSETEAQKLLDLKDTSMWSLRKRRKLVFSKVGSKTFYSLKSIEKLINNNSI